MRKICFLLLLACACGACHKRKSDSILPQDFRVTVGRIQAQRIHLELFPEYEFTRYCMDIMPVDSFRNTYVSDADYIYRKDTSLQRIAKETPAIQLKNLLQEGTLIVNLSIPSDEEYYLLLYSYNGSRPVNTLRKELFRTLPRKISDLHIDSVTLLGETIAIYPSILQDPSATYFWDFTPLKDIRDRYLGLHSYYFFQLMENYYELDEMADFLVSGTDTESWRWYYNDNTFAIGDTMVVMAVGYDSISGETTDRYEAWWLVRPEEDTQTVRAVPAETDGLEDMFMPKNIK